MQDYISQINNAITTAFPLDWWKEYGFEKEVVENQQEEFSKFEKKLTDLRGSIFDLLNSSILIGEFCKIDEFDKLLASSRATLDNIIQPTPNTDVQEFLQNTFNVNFLIAIKVALSVYSDLFQRVKRRFEMDDRKFIHSSNPEMVEIFEKSEFNDEVIKELLFLDTNRKLTEFDIELKPVNKDYDDLLGISYDLVNDNKLGGNLFSLLLRQKCDFLLAKWIFRQEHIHRVPVFSVVNNKEVELSVDNFKKDNPIISHWRKYIESHYELSSKWKSDVQRDYNSSKNITYKNATLKDLHRFIKYFKDVNPNITQLKLIREEVNRRFEEIRSDGHNHDKYAYSIALNYAINNEFSLMLQENQTDESIQALYEEILIIQAKTTIQNFFPQFKYLNYLVGKLDKVYNQRKAIESIEPARIIIDKCEKIFLTYQKNIEWSKLYYNYAFKLPYSECNIEIRNAKLPYINIFSSFLLPLSRENYIKEFRENQQKVYTLKSSIEVFENMENDLAELNMLKKELQQKETKSMEVIAIFTAIVTFVAVSIPSFKYIHTPYQAALFMFALSSSLCLFLLVLLTVTKGKDKVRANVKYIVGILLFVILSWTALISFTKDPLLRVIEPPTEINSTDSSSNKTADTGAARNTRSPKIDSSKANKEVKGARGR